MARVGVRLGAERSRRLALRAAPPEAAIPPEEDAVSIDAAIALRATFAADSAGVRASFDALVELLRGGVRKHWMYQHS